jgi:hypothetical protein
MSCCEQQVEPGTVFIVIPNTSAPAFFNKNAATEESTPPLIATATFFPLYLDKSALALGITYLLHPFLLSL